MHPDVSISQPISSTGCPATGSLKISYESERARSKALRILKERKGYTEPNILFPCASVERQFLGENLDGGR
jgi:hypothetical protein